MKKTSRKRVDIVSIRLKEMELVREKSILYSSLSDYSTRAITSPEDAYSLVENIFEGQDRELFVAAYLNTKNEPTAISIISIGSLNSSIVHPREIYKPAILANANSCIVYHNHPSGNPLPSQEDINITKRLKEASEIIGIKLLDHLIIGDWNVSMKERGDL